MTKTPPSIRYDNKNLHEIDVCDDKGEINLRIRIKIDWKLKRYWIKHIKIDHKEVED